jgi:hypothetical protein
VPTASAIPAGEAAPILSSIPIRVCCFCEPPSSLRGWTLISAGSPCRRKIEMTPGAQSRDDTPLTTNARARDPNCIL